MRWAPPSLQRDNLKGANEASFPKSKKRKEKENCFQNILRGIFSYSVGTKEVYIADIKMRRKLFLHRCLTRNTFQMVLNHFKGQFLTSCTLKHFMWELIN